MLSYYKGTATQFNTFSEVFNSILGESKKHEDKITRDFYEYSMNGYAELNLSFDKYAESLREHYLTPIGYAQNKTKSVSGLIQNSQRAQDRLKEAEGDRDKKFEELTNARSKGRDKVSVAKENLEKVCKSIRFRARKN